MKSTIPATIFAISALAAQTIPAGATTLDAASGTYSYALTAGAHNLSGTDLAATIPYTYNVAQPASGGGYAISFHADPGVVSSRVDFLADGAAWAGPYSDTASNSFTYYLMILGPTATVSALLSADTILTDDITSGDVLSTATAGLSVQCDAGANAGCATPFFSDSDLANGFTYASGTLLTGVEYAVHLTTAVSLSAAGQSGGGTARAYLAPGIGIDPALANPDDYTIVLSDGVSIEQPAVAPTPPSVPEPATLALLLSGAVMLGGVRGRWGARDA